MASELKYQVSVNYAKLKKYPSRLLLVVGLSSIPRLVPRVATGGRGKGVEHLTAGRSLENR